MGLGATAIKLAVWRLPQPKVGGEGGAECISVSGGARYIQKQRVTLAPGLWPGAKSLDSLIAS